MTVCVWIEHENMYLQKDLLKTKDTLYRLAANVKFLPDRLVF